MEKTERPRISDEEFAARVSKTQQLMREHGIDVLMAFGNEAEPQFVRYYCDYWPSFETAGVLMGQEGAPILLIGPESLTFARDRSRVKEIRRVQCFRESSNPEYPGERLDRFEDAVRDVTASESPRTAAVAGHNVISHLVYVGYQSALKQLGVDRIISADDLVMQLRVVKSEAEIACMRRASAMSHAAMDRVIREIRPGMTELQLRGIACASIYEQGAENEAYPMWSLAGKGSDQAISRPRHRPIGKNELVHIGVGARYEGYASSIGRQVITGRPEPWMLDAIRTAYEAHEAVSAQLCSGNNARQVADTFYRLMEKRSFTEWVLYGPCHGTGLMECEPPWIESDSDFALLENMTFCIDIFLANTTAQGLRVEDSVRVGTGGADNLTNYPRELFIV